MLFYKSKQRSQWIYCDHFEIYVRKGFHNINSKTYRFIDIANVTVDEDLRNMGIFQKVLKALMEQYPSENLYIESVLSKPMEHIAQKFGFSKMDLGESCNYVLIRDHSEMTYEEMVKQIVI